MTSCQGPAGGDGAALLENPWLTRGGATQAEPPAPWSATLEPPRERPATPVALALRQLGLTEGFELAGLGASRELFVPVNPGLRPETLALHLLPSPGLPEGYVRVVSGGRVLAQAPLPKEERVALLPLEGAEVRAGGVALRLEMVLAGTDRCAAEALHRLFVAPESRVYFAGTPLEPAQLSAFFPPYLERVSLYLPETLSESAAQMALMLAAYLPRRYPGVRPELRVARYADPSAALPPAGVWERVVVWHEGVGALLASPPGGGVVLLLGGTREAAQLFALPPLSAAPVTQGLVAQTLTREAFELHASAELGAQVRFGDLGYGPVVLEGSGALATAYTFALADLGPDAVPLGVRLRLQHSPVAEGEGYLQVFLNGRQVTSAPLAGTRFDTWFELPRGALARDNTLELRLAYRAAGGDCSRGALPLSVTVEPDSALSVTRGALGDGFASFPQALLPRFAVFLETLEHDAVALAAQLVGALQATTRAALEPVLVTETEVAAPLLAVGDAGSALSAALGAPLQSPGFRLSDPSGPLLVSFEPADAFASLQAFRRGGAPTLLLGQSSGAAEDLRAALVEDVLRDDGWYGLAGDVALRGAAEPVTTLRLASDLRLTPLPEPPEAMWVRYRSLIYLGLAALALALLVSLYPLVVRRGKARPPT
ncbi:cellulose biosynthesis cyclic di-GMP-binding regulatory protein BcsB [Truepera radiovictrix]|uniref:cellulose biosynthesis cyclic di-GMP-binding regulatory protein BcsB n=1 Tax=Truepera radiovictrix TaxID=332249 RepID=UPI00160A71D5|nr:cellulose biosynthesis cyclic di-GMP-binding regulatory protein BcsB [Truepera radiovictrix]WMT56890.1 cellulose biosynthesis cyclic di-GMP-binding regulatory protein BcsB [Truepera radiovictrix]